MSNTLHGDYADLEEVGDGVYDLFFCFYQIGRYELRANKIHNTVSRVRVSRRRVDLASRLLPMSLDCTVLLPNHFHEKAKVVKGLRGEQPLVHLPAVAFRPTSIRTLVELLT